MEGYCWLPYGTCKLSLRERLKKNEDMSIERELDIMALPSGLVSMSLAKTSINKVPGEEFSGNLP
ncbi:hypothetical protein GBAR_LOCUS22626 [Geodia barretti]|uniref:Uncharacterized protein n=1 Tax=Geodia barretti TaxID=519541 RepID=A0AA35T445_GEOBA|nr:hypothetical protein GBAR_LOCUS22626 [Geodia barretti]